MSTGAIPSPMAGYNDMSDTILSNGKAKKKKKRFYKLLAEKSKL